jgi:hypothetical protein
MQDVAANRLLAEADFDRWVEDRWRAYYSTTETRGQPSLPPGVYFRMLFGVGKPRALQGVRRSVGRRAGARIRAGMVAGHAPRDHRGPAPGAGGLTAEKSQCQRVANPLHELVAGICEIPENHLASFSSAESHHLFTGCCLFITQKTVRSPTSAITPALRPSLCKSQAPF